MAEAKKKPRKAAGEAANLVTVYANRLREALKHTFEGVTMLFDCIGLNVPVGDPVREEEEKPKESSSAGLSWKHRKKRSRKNSLRKCLL